MNLEQLNLKKSDFPNYFLAYIHMLATSDHIPCNIQCIFNLDSRAAHSSKDCHHCHVV